ncbi:MAG: acyltransferase family protein [Candidatus Thorarchaeota archaeon]
MAEVEVPHEPWEEISEEVVAEKRPYYFQLDVLKAVAIVFVVMDHSLTWEIKGSMGNLFWERLSIPFFLIVMGFNMAFSFKYRGAESLRDLYTIDYFKRKIVRYVFPFLVLYMGSILLGLYLNHLEWNEYIFLGYLPFWGPGNWFIPLLFGSIVVFPLVYWAFNKQPEITLFLCFLSEILLQAIMYFFFPYPIETALEGFIVSAIRVNVLFFLPAVGLGLWFSRAHSLSERRNWFMYIYFPISLIFMIDYQTHWLSSIPGGVGQFFTNVDTFIRGDYTLLFYGYAAFIFLIALAVLPRVATGRFQRVVGKIGKASYHILLAQIFWFSIVYYQTYLQMLANTGVPEPYAHVIPQFHEIWSFPISFYAAFYLLNLVVAGTLGYLWFWAEKRVNTVERPWWKHFWMQRTAYLFMAIFSLILMGASIQFISDISGLTEWGRTHDLFIFNDVTGPPVMANVIAIIFFIGLCMLFMYKSFTIADEEIPV